jgi:hypothetical protein
MKRLQRTISTLLVILALTGIQVVQASPLHDHLDQVADCLLCHYDNNSHSLPESMPVAPAYIAHLPPEDSYSLRIPASGITAFNSRAPPLYA